MAIFGNFSDIPLPDVLSMMGQSAGRFSIWNHPSNHFYRLYLNNSSLRKMEIDGVVITEILEVRSHMIDLMSSQEGEFEFVKNTETVDGPLSLPLEQVLLSGLTAVDEIAAFSEVLPSEDTFFKFSGRTDIFLDETLGIFWEQCGYYLLNGASSRVLKAQTAYGIDEIRLYLYKLRSLGLIVPSRRYEVAPEPAAEECGTDALASYGLGTLPLKPIWEDGTAAEEIAPEPRACSVLPVVRAPEPKTMAPVEVTSLQTVQTARTAQPILKSILGHLQGVLRFK